MLEFIKSISYRDTNQFPKLFLDYIDQKDQLKDFYKHSPDLNGFKKLIEERKSFDSKKRETLKNHLLNQYSSVEISDSVKHNIESLGKQNTFTITTGHQLNLFTGPLYFIYKVITVINLAEKLKESFPAQNFVPVYWMASEDHDFEEIQYFNFEGKKYKWDSEQKGAVGRFSLDKINEYLKELPISDAYKSYYSNSKSLGEAHLKLVNHLFSEYGLLILDADSKELKNLFADVAKKDVESQISFKETESSTKSLQKLGYSTPVNPRKINYFYLDKGIRERVELKDGSYFYESEGTSRNLDLPSLLAENADKLSPNVISRPLYQEYILPNLAYIGGPSELSYWLQLKSTFEALNVNFPLLLPRYSSSILSNKAMDKLHEINLEDIQWLFKEDREVLKDLLIKNDMLNTDQHNEWSSEIESLFKSIRLEAEKKDMTLGPSVEGRKKKVLKELDKIRKKMETAEIRNQDILKSRFYFSKKELFPNGSFQERYDNVFQYLLENESFISELKNNFPDPLNFSHIIFKS